MITLDPDLLKWFRDRYASVSDAFGEILQAFRDKGDPGSITSRRLMPPDEQ